MAVETPSLPRFELHEALDISNDLANQAHDFEEQLRSTRTLTPDERAEITLKRNQYLVGLLEMRALIKTQAPGYFGSSYSLIDIDVDVVEREDEPHHRFSRNRLTIHANAGDYHDVYNLRLDELASARGTTSSEIRRIIGGSDHESHEGSPEYMERMVAEIIAAQQYKAKHPENSEETDGISWELAARLITMRKIRPTVPLRIGMYSKPTENSSEDERHLVFVFGEDLFAARDPKNEKRVGIFELLPDDQQHIKINPDVIIDESGKLNSDRAGVTPSSPYLEAKLKKDGNSASWHWSYSPAEFDFFVLTNEETGALSIFQNLPQAQA